MPVLPCKPHGLYVRHCSPRAYTMCMIQKPNPDAHSPGPISPLVKIILARLIAAELPRFIPAPYDSAQRICPLLNDFPGSQHLSLFGNCLANFSHRALFKPCDCGEERQPVPHGVRTETPPKRSLQPRHSGSTHLIISLVLSSFPPSCSLSALCFSLDLLPTPTYQLLLFPNLWLVLE